MPMPIVPFRGQLPVVADDVFVASTAHVVGAVRIGARSNLWFGATVRGDTGTIEIGEAVSIQECATVHTQGGTATIVGNGVTMGHHALIHAAVVEDDVLVGINASVLSGARVGHHSIIAAHALVPEGKEIPPYSLVIGAPGKVIRQVTEAEIERILGTSANYVRLGQEYRALEL